MANERYDVVILGGGNAGMGVTVPTRAKGLKVALIEARDLGGTCPNRGCTPKKILVAAAHAMDEIGRASTHAIRVARPRLDWARLIDREKNMIGWLPAAFAATLRKRGVAVIRGRGRFAGPNTVRVGRRTLEARHIVIAAGSKPRTLPFPGADLLVTSDDVLSDRRLPGSVAFVGGGVIGLELGHVYARAGARVTVLEVLPRLLPGADDDAVARLRAESERIGIAIRTSATVRRVERAGRRFRIVFEHEGRTRTLVVDRVVNGAGRVADLEGLDLAAGGVKHDGTRVAADGSLRSVSNPAVWVCGDALWSKPQLSPLATYEGQVVGRNIAEGARHRPDYRAIPSAVYTVPALASVGLTEAAARAKGLPISVRANDMIDWFSASTYGESAAWSKVLVHGVTDRILGAHILGHAGEELIHLFALAMRHGITAKALRETVYAFPTFSADIKSMV
jgi:glutathione reductase (NADPH)